MNLEQLQAFVKIVQSGSFTKAAELMGSQKSHLSRLLTQLEARLGVKLMERSTRSLSLTEMGREVYERAVAILAAVDDTERLAHNANAAPRGTLRLTCGAEFGTVAVSGWVDEYLYRHPQMACEVEYTSRLLDLVHEGFDLAIRVGALEESRLAARLLGTVEYGLFACPRYLAKHPAPQTPDELRQHDLVLFSDSLQRTAWKLSRGTQTAKVEGHARLRVNNSFAVRDALLRSLGVGRLPLMIAGEAMQAGRLVPVLPEWKPQPAPVHAVFPSNRYLTPKVRCFIDLAVERFGVPPPIVAASAAPPKKAARKR